jgi:predicted transcriptional regulator
MSLINETRTLGEQELEMLRYIADNAPVSAGEVSTAFGQSNGLARSTVETVMERLRKKGFLARSREDNVFKYRPTQAQNELMSGLVEKFVEKTLAGSLVPLVTYFSKQNRLSETELEELQRLVAKLQDGEEDR